MLCSPGVGQGGGKRKGNINRVDSSSKSQTRAHKENLDPDITFMWTCDQQMHSTKILISSFSQEVSRSGRAELPLYRVLGDSSLGTPRQTQLFLAGLTGLPALSRVSAWMKAPWGLLSQPLPGPGASGQTATCLLRRSRGYVETTPTNTSSSRSFGLGEGHPSWCGGWELASVPTEGLP